MTTDKYLVYEDNVGSFVSLEQAGAAMNSMWSRVVLKDIVLKSDFSVRFITDDERSKIQHIADEMDRDK